MLSWDKEPVLEKNPYLQYLGATESRAQRKKEATFKMGGRKEKKMGKEELNGAECQFTHL